MARPKEFNETEALDRAVAVFWEKGYEAASLQDLLHAMDLSKSSLYETFGSKHKLFLAALARYNKTELPRAINALTQAGSGKEAIIETFAGLVDKLVGPEGQRGCLVSNCAIEARNDEAAEARVRVGHQHFEDAFYHAILRGQEAGEIATEKDARTLARFLTASVNGLEVMAKTNPGQKALEDVVEVVLGTLG